MKNKKNIGLTALLAFTVLLSLTTQPVFSKTSPSVAMKIMKNIDISGLINDGEQVVVKYAGKGSYDGNNEVWYFSLWRQRNPGWDKDLQAHIELRKVGDGVYIMEIYHSWTTISVDMPPQYEYTVMQQTAHLLVLRITVNL